MQVNQTVPFAVSVVAKVLAAPRNLLTVVNNRKDFNKQTGSGSHKFAVCVKPLHFDYNRVSVVCFGFSGFHHTDFCA